MLGHSILENASWLVLQKKLIKNDIFLCVPKYRLDSGAIQNAKVQRNASLKTFTLQVATFCNHPVETVNTTSTIKEDNFQMPVSGHLSLDSHHSISIRSNGGQLKLTLMRHSNLLLEHKFIRSQSV